MPVKYLDPTLDIVFKLLLLSTPELLRDMIEAVLDPSTSIDSVEVLNPEIPKDSFTSSNSPISVWRPLIGGLSLSDGPTSSWPAPQRNSKHSPKRIPS